MKAFWTWLKGKTWDTHAIGASLLVIAGIIVNDPQARQFLISVFKLHPDYATEIVTLAGIVLAYKRSSTPASTVAQAQVIEEQPNAPTATQIEAAK